MKPNYFCDEDELFPVNLKVTLGPHGDGGVQMLVDGHPILWLANNGTIWVYTMSAKAAKRIGIRLDERGCPVIRKP